MMMSNIFVALIMSILLLLEASSHSQQYPEWLNPNNHQLLEKPLAQPNIIVAKDGSGNFYSIGEALSAYSPDPPMFSIYVKAGVYEEQVIVNKFCRNVFMYGDGIGKTIVTGSKFGKLLNITTTFANEASGFIAKWITFRNTAGPEGEQAPAFRSQGDRSTLFECSFEGYQDTLYYQQNRQFYFKCLIYGTIDFIFGMGEAVIQNSKIIVRKPPTGKPTVITADGRMASNGSGGLVIQNCSIIPDESWSPIEPNVKTFLGRPWKAYARTVVMQSYLHDFISPEGWTVWNNSSNHETCQVFEFSNHGPGAKTENRSMLFDNFKVLVKAEATNFTVASFLAAAGKGNWLQRTNISYNPGL